MSSLAAQTALILRNDLRLLWRDLQQGKFKGVMNVGLIVVLFVVANAVSIGIFFALRRQPSLGAETLAWLFFGFLMLGTAMNHAISVLFERADFDLLLASPVSPRAILLARLAAMTVGAALSVAFFLLPLLHGLMFALSWRYAASYLVWLLLSCAVASAGVWFTLLLVQWLGPRRARTWAQVIAALLGASIYLLTQGQNFVPLELREKLFTRASGVLGHPLLAFVARAGRGEWLPLLALGAVTVVFAAMTTRVLGKMFISGVQEAGAIVAPRRRNGRRQRHVFTEGVARATFWKDVRLILRDPLLLAQVLPQALYFLPAIFGLHRLGGVTLLGPLALVIAGQFSIALTAVSASGEECWDLIRMSPTPELRLRLAKMAAGMALPLALCALVCLALAVLGRPGLALLAFMFATLCASGCAWLQVARIHPSPRRDVIKRGGGGAGRIFFSTFMMMVGGGGLGFAAGTHWIVATVLLGTMTLLVLGCFTLFGMEEIHRGSFASSGPEAKAAA